MNKYLLNHMRIALICGTIFCAGLAISQSLPDISVKVPKKVEIPTIEPAPSAVSQKQIQEPSKTKSKQELQPKLNFVIPTQPNIKETPLTPQPSKISKDFYSAFKSGNVDLAEILLQNGADINCQNCGDTPLLHMSIGLSPPHVKNPIQWLVNHGANINLQDSTGATVLHAYMNIINSVARYARNFSSYEDSLKYLINNGANPSIVNSNGVTPLHEIARFIQPYSDTNTVRIAHAKNTINIFINAGAKINSVTNNGDSVLLYGMSSSSNGAHYCNRILVEHLISLGADVSLKNNNNITPYSIAYDLAVGGAKDCNALLGILNPDNKQNIIIQPVTKVDEIIQPPPIKIPVQISSASIAIPLPAEFAGEYTGVSHMKTPTALSAGMTGVLNTRGSVTIHAPFNVSITGFVTKVEGNHLQMRVKDRAPIGMTFSNGQKESEYYDVVGSFNNGVYRGSYNYGDISGEYILCPQVLANTRKECNPTIAESFGSAIGGILGAFGALPSSSNGKK